MPVTRPVYLDHHATTPVDPRVLQAMLPYFNQLFGNASSRQHRFGWQAEEAVERARQQVAALIGAKAKEIVFTSGATEANNLAIRGAVAARSARGAPRGHRGDRAPCGARHLPAARARRLQRDGAAGGSRRPGRSGSLRRGAHRPDGARLGDGRQQRDRRDPAAAGAGPGLPGARRVAAHRRRAGGGAGAVRRRGDRRGPGVAHRAQDVRPEGRRRALRAALTAGRDRAALHRRRPGTRPSSGDVERAGHRRPGGGGRTLPPGAGRRGAAGRRGCAIACWRRCRLASRRSP